MHVRKTCFFLRNAGTESDVSRAQYESKKRKGRIKIDISPSLTDNKQTILRTLNNFITFCIGGMRT